MGAFSERGKKKWEGTKKEQLYLHASQKGAGGGGPKINIRDKIGEGVVCAMVRKSQGKRTVLKA